MRKLLLALPILLAACGPTYHTTYEMVAPPTPQGVTCANTCLDSLSVCNSRCQTESRLCESMNFTSMNLINRPMFDDDCEPDFCMEKCTTAYRICHTNCGGTVIEHKTCTGNHCPAVLPVN